MSKRIASPLDVVTSARSGAPADIPDMDEPGVSLLSRTVASGLKVLFEFDAAGSLGAGQTTCLEAFPSKPERLSPPLFADGGGFSEVMAIVACSAADPSAGEGVAEVTGGVPLTS